MIHTVKQSGETVHIIVDSLMVVDVKADDKGLDITSDGKCDESSVGEFLSEVESDIKAGYNMFSDNDHEEPSVDFWVALTLGEEIRVITELNELKKAIEEIKEDKILDLAKISMESNAF